MGPGRVVDEDLPQHGVSLGVQGKLQSQVKVVVGVAVGMEKVGGM